jgi:hypothetical protein
LGEEVAEDEVEERNSYRLHLIHLLPSPISFKIRCRTRARQRRKLCWAGATPVVFWPQAFGKKWGRSSPTRCFARVQIDRFVRRKLFSLGHLLDRHGEREGDAQGDLCPSCTGHPFTQEETIEIRCHRHPSTTKEASKTEKGKSKFEHADKVRVPLSFPSRPILRMITSTY